MNNSIVLIMEKNIVAVDVNDSVEHVEAILDSHKLSCMPVVDSEGRCFGVISATDFLRFHTSHKNLKSQCAWEVCTHNIVTVGAGISIRDASEIIINQKIHHLVVTQDDVIKGIVSSIDILKYMMSVNDSKI